MRDALELLHATRRRPNTGARQFNSTDKRDVYGVSDVSAFVELFVELLSIE
jgi:hypothetical protein